MKPSTGIPALDETLHGLRLGDNIVWQVESSQDYAALAEPFWKAALRRGEKLVYFRFAEHAELVPADAGAQYVRLYPDAGFEKFITEIHAAIARNGRGGNYVFDMFSDLVREWYSERMVGNFFLLTCPYLFALDTIACFAVLRDFHSYHAIQPITETTQLLLDVYRHRGKLHVHPLKVDKRYSPTMHLIHLWEGDELIPITGSAQIADIMASRPWPGLKSASYRMIGMWDRRFMHGEEMLESRQRCDVTNGAIRDCFERLATQVLSRDERVMRLIREYMTLEDIIAVWKRVVGSGMVGGKTVGMLLARAILRRADPQCEAQLEPHDSFFIGSDIFYMYLVRNDCWWIRQKQKNPETLLDGIGEARRRILQGKFPDYILKRFSDMLDYFGQSPIIVRSSSLLEDAFGNAFAGKYESVFCPNQGTHQQRLEEFLNAVRVVYASALSEEALTYRAKRGVLHRDEQMALLVQRVSGGQYGELFYPQVAGVGFSINPYVWHSEIDPNAGMLRLVFGLGTRAVERSDDDYTRVVALNAPYKRPEGSGQDDVLRYSQRRVDYLDLNQNRIASGFFDQVRSQSPGLPADRFGEPGHPIGRPKRPQVTPWVVNLDRMLRKTDFVEYMRRMLTTLRVAYGCDVDIEYTLNLQPDDSYKVNLLQCRPLQIKQHDALLGPAPEIPPDRLVLAAHGAVLGYSRLLTIDRLIEVVPSRYGRLSTRDRYEIARVIGRLTHLRGEQRAETVMLVGPGRWGTKMPELGVPVSFMEINTVAVVCEVDSMHEGLTPDLSLGTHFFHEMVEMNMVYLGYFKARPENVINHEWLAAMPNRLAELVPHRAKWAEVVRVIAAPPGHQLRLRADHMQQEAKLYVELAEPA